MELSGRPILWYLIGGLYLAGFRHLVLTLGYRGEQILSWLECEMDLPGLRIDALDTGTDSPIAHRIARGLEAMGDVRDLLITNGDTVVDAGFASLYRHFQSADRDGFMLTVPAPNQFGVVVTDGDEVLDFVRQSRVHSLRVGYEGGEQTARIYSGTAFLRRERLRSWLREDGPELSLNFEQDYYGPLCREGRMGSGLLDGFWLCVDTPKDVGRAMESASAAQLEELRSRIEAIFTRPLEGRVARTTPSETATAPLR